MARNRVIYQSQAVYASQTAYDSAQTASGAIAQLDRIQSANYSFNVGRTDVNQFGDLAAIDRIITESPTVSFDTSYYLANFYNESRLGFSVTPSGGTTHESAITNIIDSATTAYQKNYYILTTKEGKDANEDYTSGDYDSIIGIGNAFITNYSSEAAVGGLPTVSISAEGQNMNFVNLPFTGDGVPHGGGPTPGFVVGAGSKGASTLLRISGESPAINAANGAELGQFVTVPVGKTSASNTGAATIASLRPGDITLTLAEKTNDTVGPATANTNSLPSDYAGASISDAHIQSYTLGFDLGRTPIEKLGSKFAFARVVDFPVTVSLSIDAVLADLTSGSLAGIIDCDKEYDARIAIKDAVCGGADQSVVCNYIVKGVKIDSQSFTSSIGDNKSVTLDFSAQIGGPNQVGMGVFMSGAHIGTIGW